MRPIEEVRQVERILRLSEEQEHALASDDETIEAIRDTIRWVTGEDTRTAEDFAGHYLRPPTENTIAEVWQTVKLSGKEEVKMDIPSKVYIVWNNQTGGQRDLIEIFDSEQKAARYIESNQDIVDHDIEARDVL